MKIVFPYKNSSLLYQKVKQILSSSTANEVIPLEYLHNEELSESLRNIDNVDIIITSDSIDKVWSGPILVDKFQVDCTGNTFTKDKVYDVISYGNINDLIFLKKLLHQMKCNLNVLFVAIDKGNYVDSNIKVAHDISYRDFIQYILQSKVMIKVSELSFSIESICCGTPVLDNTENDINSEHIKYIRNKNPLTVKSDMIEFMNYSLQDRIEMQKEYKRVYDKENWTIEFNENINRLIKEYRINPVTTLQDLFDF